MRQEFDKIGAVEFWPQPSCPQIFGGNRAVMTPTGMTSTNSKTGEGSDFILGPTHEETVTLLAHRDAVKSYKQLPLNIYRI